MKKGILGIVAILGIALMVSVNACTPASDCTDGIQNGTETGVDCGGSCPACIPTVFKFLQNGSSWSASSTTGGLVNDYDDNNEIINVYKPLAGNAYATVAVEFGSDPSTGSIYTLKSTSSGQTDARFHFRPTGLISSTVYIPISTYPGTMTIIEYNSISERISGTFSTTLYYGTDTLIITNGEFNLPFQD